jgi:hypothetical protein
VVRAQNKISCNGERNEGQQMEGVYVYNGIDSRYITGVCPTNGNPSNVSLSGAPNNCGRTATGPDNGTSLLEIDTFENRLYCKGA